MTAINLFLPNEHPVSLVLRDKRDGREIERDDITVADLEGALFLLRYMWNGATVSGGVAWRHPGTGEAYPHGLTVEMHILHPETGRPMVLAPPM